MVSQTRDLELLGNRLSTLFATNGHTARAGAWEPAVSLEETPDAMVLTVELPGLSADEIDIEIESQLLVVRGEKHETAAHEGGRYHLRERSYGPFQRAFRLPRSVQGDGISAHYENGVLSIRMPKAPEAKSRRIEIGGTEPQRIA